MGHRESWTSDSKVPLKKLAADQDLMTSLSKQYFTHQSITFLSLQQKPCTYRPYRTCILPLRRRILPIHMRQTNVSLNSDSHVGLGSRLYEHSCRNFLSLCMVLEGIGKSENARKWLQIFIVILLDVLK